MQLELLRLENLAQLAFKVLLGLRHRLAFENLTTGFPHELPKAEYFLPQEFLADFFLDHIVGAGRVAVVELVDHLALKQRQVPGFEGIGAPLVEEVAVFRDMEFAAELVTEVAKQRMLRPNLGAKLVVTLTAELHEREIFRRELPHQLNAVSDRRAARVCAGSCR